MRRLRIWITRRISSSRPITGSSLPRSARSVRSTAYLASASNAPSGDCDVTRCAPRTLRSAANRDSRVTPASRRMWATASPCCNSESNRCSVETYSSPKAANSSWLRTKTSRATGASCGDAASPLTRGTRSSAASVAIRTSAVVIPDRSRVVTAMPSLSASSAASRCSGRIWAWPRSAAMLAAWLMACCDRSVNRFVSNAIFANLLVRRWGSVPASAGLGHSAGNRPRSFSSPGACRDPTHYLRQIPLYYLSALISSFYF